MRLVPLWETDLPGSALARARRGIVRHRKETRQPIRGIVRDESITACEICITCGVEKEIIHMTAISIEGRWFMECSHCNPKAREATLRHMRRIEGWYAKSRTKYPDRHGTGE